MKKYTKWYQWDCLLAVLTMVSCSVNAAFLVQEWLKTILEIAGLCGMVCFFVIFFAKKLYRTDRIHPQWLTRLQIIIRILSAVLIITSFIALALTDREHIRDVLYH